MAAKPAPKATTRPRSPNVPTVAKTRPDYVKPKPASATLRPASKPSSERGHRPSGSYSGPTTSYSSISERIDNLLKEIEQKKAMDLAQSVGKTKPAGTPVVRAKSREQASASPKPTQESGQQKHRRWTSYSSRPQSQLSSKPLEPEKTHTRKLSYDRPPVRPKSLISSVSHRSEVGYIPDNPAKVNQDIFIEIVGFARNSELHFFGVCDGHGYYGGEVSGYLKDRLPIVLSQDPMLLTNPRKALTDCILHCDQELLDCPFDVNFSGSTLNVVLIVDKTLWCANVGDSRAIVARQLTEPSKSGSRQTGRHWMCIALSRDHKPDDKDESLRILSQGGRIEAYQDEEGNPLGPARVWLQDQDIPGLAMSRSMGDAVAASVGVFSEPEILEFHLTPEDKFLVVGSDGVFEFLSNEEIVKLVVPFWKTNDTQGACDAVSREARTRWTTEEEVIDDITCVIVFFDVN